VSESLRVALNVAGTAAVFHVYVLLWTAECVFTELRLDINTARHCWLWHWRSATVVRVKLFHLHLVGPIQKGMIQFLERLGMAAEESD